MHVYTYKNRITKVGNNCIVFTIAIENFYLFWTQIYYFFSHKKFDKKK